MKEQKEFLVKDLSGRGIVAKLRLSDFKERWDLSYSNNPDEENEPTLGDWLDSAELGDEYHHDDDASLIACIEEGR